MKLDVLLGLQWGDEGKGKIVDVITPNYDIVARFQGGPNAGHTLEFNNMKHVLHTIPSGIFRDNVMNVVGNGVVIDPIVLKGEIEALIKIGVNVKSKLLISKKAHIILPTHRLLDAEQEKSKGAQKIGSTLKGIGPTYTDKVGRLGLRVGDVLSERFKEIYESKRDEHIKKLEMLHFEVVDLAKMEEDFYEAINFLKQYQIINTEYYINNALKNNKRVLAEGAQGSLLDIDFGSYPYVTSSNTICAGACNGLGVAPNKIGDVYGIFKAYCTRVGSGPFPTELHDEVGEKLREVGREFGATTGRPRRCGWLDLPALKYTIMLNGVTKLIMMKADVLSMFDTIKVCDSYNINDKTTSEFPFDLNEQEIEPLYNNRKGWQKDLTSLNSKEDLPPEVFEYISYIEKETNVPVEIVSCGPDRKQTFFLSKVMAQ